MKSQIKINGIWHFANFTKTSYYFLDQADLLN